MTYPLFEQPPSPDTAHPLLQTVLDGAARTLEVYDAQIAGAQVEINSLAAQIGTLTGLKEQKQNEVADLQRGCEAMRRQQQYLLVTDPSVRELPLAEVLPVAVDLVRLGYKDSEEVRTHAHSIAWRIGQITAGTPILRAYDPQLPDSNYHGSVATEAPQLTWIGKPETGTLGVRLTSAPSGVNQPAAHNIPLYRLATPQTGVFVGAQHIAEYVNDAVISHSLQGDYLGLTVNNELIGAVHNTGYNLASLGIAEEKIIDIRQELLFRLRFDTGISPLPGDIASLFYLDDTPHEAVTDQIIRTLAQQVVRQDGGPRPGGHLEYGSRLMIRARMLALILPDSRNLTKAEIGQRTQDIVAQVQRLAAEMR